MKENKNGFTLVELIAVITITGVVSLFTIPALGKVLSDNSTRACKYYEKAMIEAARSYIMKEETDILENPSLGGVDGFPSNYNLNVNVNDSDGIVNSMYNSIKTQPNLINTGYIEDFKDTRTRVTRAYITVNRDSTKTYTYTPHLLCSKKNGEELYTK